MLTNLFPPVVSGSSTHSWLLSRELVLRGHSVCVITARIDPTTPEYELQEGVSIYRLPAMRLPRTSLTFNFPWLSYTYTPANQRRIREILRRHDADVLHLHNHMFDLGLSASRARRRLSKPLVVTIHTVFSHPNPLWNGVLRCADNLIVSPLVVAQASALICPDINIRAYVRTAYGRSEEPLVPYGVGVPGQPLPSLVEEYRSSFALEGKRIILSLGHVHEIRNRADLVLAMPAVLERIPQAVLLIVGAVATTTPARLSRSLGIQNSVRLVGPVPHDHVPALLKLADLEAHWLNQKSSESTSLGIASLEAMSAGLPVVTAANPDTYGPGVLRDGDNIVLVDRGNPEALAAKLVELLGDPELRARIGERARQTIEEHFSWDVVCRTTTDVYRDVMERQS
jgi:glycosyltransferase involved in cell wall biosynthesis